MRRAICLIPALLLGATTASLAADVRSHMLVNTEELAKLVGKPGLVVLHVARDRNVYDREHVPGAQFLAIGDFVIERNGTDNELPPAEDLVVLLRSLGIDRRSRIVLYDEQAGLWAARAFVTLDYLGLGGRAALLDGQWARWKREARPVTRAAPAVPRSSFVPRLRPETVVGLNEVRDVSWLKKQEPSAGVALLDARPEGDFRGERKDDSRPGHIPAAVSVYWLRNLVSQVDPVMRSARDLRALYQSAGVTPSDLIVVYCRSGVQASHTYFTLKYLGYDVRLYDGSMLEWMAARDTTIER